MKRFLTIVAAAVLLAVGTARAQEIRDISTEVSLYKDGSAKVVQTWDVTVVKGTERYIPIDNLGKSYIHDFSVTENGRKYESDGRKWKSDRSASAKAYRCGIIEKSGGDIELCWGQGEYGDHVYTLSYTIDNLVLDYGDCDAFHWHFLNDEWEDKPKHVSFKLINKTGGPAWFWNSEDDNNIRFWPFGMVGECWIENGVVYAESSEPLRYSSFFSLMARFDKGMFAPAAKAKGSFEDLKEEAFKGSDYGDKGGTDWEEVVGMIIGVVVFVLIPLLVIIAVIVYIVRRIYWRISGKKYKKAVFGTNKIDGWYRDVPLEGNPTAFFSLLQEGDNLAKKREKVFPNLVSAYFLKWIQEGLLVVERDPKKDKHMNLRFVKGMQELEFDDSMEGKVYEAAMVAAGDNNLLEANEFKRWSYRNDKTVAKWPNEAVYSGRSRWQPASQEERRHAVEFKNFLNDFTVMDQREAPEVNVWKKYMVLAASLGIAEKVAKNFEKLFPKMMQEYARESNMTDLATTYWILNSTRTSSNAMMSSAMSHQAARAAQARRSSGGGGSISFGGGGGGFGGGHGGGSR